MPIRQFLKDTKAEPEEIDILNRAFERALRSLELVDREDPITEIVARKIIAIGKSGVRDPSTIARIAVEQLKR